MIKNQHYIPRSYLKNFGYLVNTYTRPSGKVDERWSIFNIENGSEIKVNNTKKICYEKHLYDLPEVDEEFRQSIEHAYDKKVDRHFSEVTKFLCNPNNVTITEDMHKKVLTCFLSLHFRTPKHVGIDFQELRSKGYSDQEINRIKTMKLEKHLENFEKLFELRKNCSISVNQASGGYQYISGDNPLVYRHPEGGEVDIFNPDTLIHVPISPEFCLTIFPESETKGTPKITRFYHPNHNVITINYDIEMNHQRYMFGTKDALEQYVDESPLYKQPVDDNHPLLQAMKATLEGVQKCLEVMQNHGVLSHQHRGVFKHYWDNVQMFREDPNNLKMAKILKVI